MGIDSLLVDSMKRRGGVPGGVLVVRRVPQRGGRGGERGGYPAAAAARGGGGDPEQRPGHAHAVLLVGISSAAVRVNRAAAAPSPHDVDTAPCAFVNVDY